MAAAHCFQHPEDHQSGTEGDRPLGKHSTLGATEDQVNHQATVPQRTDQTGTKIEDLAGTGTFEGSGG